VNSTYIKGSGMDHTLITASCVKACSPLSQVLHTSFWYIEEFLLFKLCAK